jgi:hypothetical protein
LIDAVKADILIKQAKLRHTKAIVRTARIRARMAKITQEKTVIQKRLTHLTIASVFLIRGLPLSVPAWRQRTPADSAGWITSLASYAPWPGVQVRPA